MNAKITLAVGGSACFFCLASAVAFTEQELVEQGRHMLALTRAADFDNEADLIEAQESDDPIDIWEFWRRDAFFDFFMTNGWTRADCEMAFDKYCTWVSTNDMTTFSIDDAAIAKCMVGQCEDMNYTNAVDTIRTYAMNPTALNRSAAIGAAVRLGGVDAASAVFIETFATNRMGVSAHEISYAIGEYCDKLKSIDTNDVAAVEVQCGCARFFYANRANLSCAYALDALLVQSFPGYAASSNRLDYALSVLSWSDNNQWRDLHNHFVAVTNALLNAAQPLPAVEGL